MRVTLETYLSLDDHSISGLANKINRTSQTVRRWAKDSSLTKIVEFDVKTGDVDFVEVGKMTIIRGR